MRFFQRSAIAVALFTVGLGVSAIPSTARSRDYYGAIAYSPSSGNHGYSYDYNSRQGAENRALSECNSLTAAGDCIVLVWFSNGCGALAESSRRDYGSGWGATQQIAESYALQGCGQYASDCAITRWVCTTR